MSEQENKSSFKPDYFFWGVFICLTGLFAWVATPNFVGPRRSGPTWDRHICINNFRQIDAAANQFALEQRKTNGEVIHFPDDLTPYIKFNSAGKIPQCPAGGLYHITKVGEVPTCSLGTTVTPAHVLP